MWQGCPQQLNPYIVLLYVTATTVQQSHDAELEPRQDVADSSTCAAAKQWH